MLMSASSNHALTIRERLFDDSPVTPAVRANDTTDIHLARGATYAEQPVAAVPHRQHRSHPVRPPRLRARGADARGEPRPLQRHVQQRPRARPARRSSDSTSSAKRPSARASATSSKSSTPTSRAPSRPSVLPGYINDMIARMLAGVAPAGRPLFLKMVYHGPKAMEELVRFDPHLVVGILGGSAGTTRDAFQLLHDAQKYGAKVALFGRKINNAENQLAFVHFLRLIVEGQIGPVEAVKAYHAVLGKLGLRPHRTLEDDLQADRPVDELCGNQELRWSSRHRPVRSTTSTTPVPLPALSMAASVNGASPCQCHSAPKGRAEWQQRSLRMPKSSAQTPLSRVSVRCPCPSAPPAARSGGQCQHHVDRRYGRRRERASPRQLVLHARHHRGAHVACVHHHRHVHRVLGEPGRRGARGRRRAAPCGSRTAVARRRPSALRRAPRPAAGPASAAPAVPARRSRSGSRPARCGRCPAPPPGAVPAAARSPRPRRERVRHPLRAPAPAPGSGAAARRASWCSRPSRSRPACTPRAGSRG